MSYAALGYDIVIGTPVGNQKISIPLEKMAKDAATMALDAAWPPLQQKLHAELPNLLSQAQDAAVSAAVNKLWPQMRPKLQVELDSAIDKGSTEAQKIAALLGLGLAATIVLSAMWIKKRTP